MVVRPRNTPASNRTRACECSGRRLQDPPALGPGNASRARRRAPVQFADQFGRLRDRAGERQPVQQHVVLPSPGRRIGQNGGADVADDADRLDGLGEEQRARHVGGVEIDPFLVRGVRQLGGKADADGRPPRRFRKQADLGGDDRVRTSCVLSPVTVSSEASGASGSRLLMLRRL